jgi:hypothetical protein
MDGRLMEPDTRMRQDFPGMYSLLCRNVFERWRGTPDHPYEQGFDLRLVPEKLEEPLKWKRGRRIFVNSMSDLFHDGVPEATLRRSSA